MVAMRRYTWYNPFLMSEKLRAIAVVPLGVDTDRRSGVRNDPGFPVKLHGINFAANEEGKELSHDCCEHCPLFDARARADAGRCSGVDLVHKGSTQISKLRPDAFLTVPAHGVKESLYGKCGVIVERADNRPYKTYVQ